MPSISACRSSALRSGGFILQRPSSWRKLSSISRQWGAVSQVTFRPSFLALRPISHTLKTATYSPGYVGYDEQTQRDGWYSTGCIKIDDLRNGPEGWCFCFEDVENSADAKIVFYDARGNALGYLDYEDRVGEEWSVEDIRTYAKQFDATDLTFNFYAPEIEVGKDVIYIDGRCRGGITRYFYAQATNFNGDKSELSNVLEFKTNSHNYEKVTTKATCQQQGSTNYKCPRCQNSLNGDIFPKLPHIVGTVNYKWSTDNYPEGTGDNIWSCKATATCSGNNTSSHELVAEAIVAHNIVTNPTTTSTGSQTCVATFQEEWASAQTKTVNMAVRLKSPYNDYVTYYGLNEASGYDYTVDAYNPNTLEPGQASICVTLFDEDGVILVSRDYQMDAPGYLSNKKITLSSSSAASTYQMVCTGQGYSDSVPVYGHVSGGPANAFYTTTGSI